VGRFLPKRDREDIQQELRSLLLDKLEDRGAMGGEAAPDEDAVVALLEEMGRPREVATSYGKDRYLVGPEHFPLLLQVLRIGAIVYVLLYGVGLFVGLDSVTLTSFLESILGLFGNLFGFFGVVVLVFAILEWQDVKIKLAQPEWDPRALPKLDAPGRIDRAGMIVGIGLNVVALSVTYFFWRRGGVPYVVNPTSDATLLALPRNLLMVAMVVTGMQIAVDVLVWLRSRWDLVTRLVRSLLDIGGVYVLYRIMLAAVDTLTDSLLPVGVPVDLLRLGVNGFLVLLLAVVVIDGAVKAFKLALAGARA
jgi:hypothetical protein